MQGIITLGQDQFKEEQLKLFSHCGFVPISAISYICISNFKARHNAYFGSTPAHKKAFQRIGTFRMYSHISTVNYSYITIISTGMLFDQRKITH